VVTGQVTNDGDRNVDVRVACALRNAESLAGVGIGFLHDLQRGSSSTFAISIQFVRGQPDAVECTADPNE